VKSAQTHFRKTSEGETMKPQ